MERAGDTVGTDAADTARPTRDAPLWFPTGGPVFLGVGVVLSVLALVAGILAVFIGPLAIASAVSAKARGQRGATAVLVVAISCFIIGITAGVFASGGLT